MVNYHAENPSARPAPLGFLRIANALIEALYRAKLPGRHLSVVLAIVRCTYGWNREAAELGAGDLADLTDYHASHVRNALADLRRWGIVVTTPGDPGRPSLVALQPDCERWRVPAYGQRRPALRDRRRAQRAALPPRTESGAPQIGRAHV